MLIYLITHAHTKQVPDVAADAWRLSADGEAQAEALAQESFWHDVDRIIVSSEPKTLLTLSEVVRQRQIPVWVDCRFDELRRSRWIEDYAAQVATLFADPMHSLAGWESVESVRQRALTALDDVQKRFAGETLALVGHGLCLSIMRAEILQHPKVSFEAWQRLSFASVACIGTAPLVLIKDFDLSLEVVRQLDNKTKDIEG